MSKPIYSAFWDWRAYLIADLQKTDGDALCALEIDLHDTAERIRGELKRRDSIVPRPQSDRTRCPRCGRTWLPSMDASETFPGSACDMGECWGTNDY